jgi:glycosyltransferase involved in cell wall biosynthesis
MLLISHGGALGGGAEFVFDELVRSLRRYAPSIDVLVVLPSSGVLADRAIAYGAEVAIVPQPRWAEFGRRTKRAWLAQLTGGADSLVRMIRLILRWKPDVVLSNTMTIPIGAVAAKACRVRHIWMIQEFGRRDHDLAFALGYERTVRLIGRLSDILICCSRAVADELRDHGVPDAQLLVAYQGVDFQSDDPLPVRRTREPLRALLVGRIARSKGQLVAIQGLAAAVQMGADVHLTLVGGVHEPEYLAVLESYIREYGLQGRVAIPGATDDPRGAYRDAHVALMCSRDEAFGRVSIEAMKLGLPVIGIASGGTTEIVVDGRSGLLVPVECPHQIGAALAALWRDEERRLALGQFAREDAILRFSVEHWVRELVHAALPGIAQEAY